METRPASRQEQLTPGFRRCLIALGISLFATPAGIGLMFIDLPFGTPDGSEGGGFLYSLGAAAACGGAICGAISALGILVFGLGTPSEALQSERDRLSLRSDSGTPPAGDATGAAT